ncbi:MAG: ABC transporter substrate-binding protein [Candidatus Methylomirabilales bacterium]
MMRRFGLGIGLVLAGMLLLGVGPAAAQVTTLRFVWFTDGPDRPAIEGLVKRFNESNSDVRVDLSIVPFAELNQLLVTQASAGQAPDLARVTEPYRFFQYALDLRPHLINGNFPKEFLDEPLKSITGERGEVYGIPHDLTMNGPLVNVSLFKKAGVELPKGDRVTWEEWMAAVATVKKATGVPFAATADRSGHRLDGFIQSYGGGFFTRDGKDVRITSPETRKAIQAFVGFHRDAIMPLDIWAGGTGYVGANQQFVNGQLVFYLSGNWQIAQFNEGIGNKFEWKAVLNGYNTQAGGMPGGKFVLAFKNTKAPDKVARLVEFLGSAAAMTEYCGKAMFLPTRKDLIKQGIKYPARNEDMNVFIKGIGMLPQSAYVDNYSLWFGPVANEVRDRVTQAIVGELSVEKALDLAQAKAKDLIRR